MNKLFFFLLLMFFPFAVYAGCSGSDISRYKSLASHISNYYEFNGTNFNITFYNVPNSLDVIDKTNNVTYSTDSSEFVVSDIKPGSIVNFGIYPKDACSSYRVSTIYVTVPYYNDYYNDPVCLNNSNQLCSKWVNTSMYSHDSFVEAVKLSKSEDESLDSVPEKEIHKYGFFDFLGDYYIYILLFIIVSGIIGIYFLDKKSKFDFSLK